MTGRLIEVAYAAHRHPLLFKQLWHAPLLNAPDQEIVYRDQRRLTYRAVRQRIGRLASALANAGAGDQCL
jgi:fatty-acyl-CoA synthase